MKNTGMNNSGKTGARRGILRTAAVLALSGVAAGAIATGGAHAVTKPAHKPSHKAKPSILLVHGAFADASSWKGEVTRLQHDGYKVTAAAVPLRGLKYDSAYIKSVLDAQPGPTILVGHSYGGAVITNAAAGDPKAAGLVYVAAFAPKQGQSVGDLDKAFGGPSTKISVPHPYPLPEGVPAPGPNDPPNVELSVKPDLFPKYFAPDVPAKQAAVMAASQRPITLTALLQPSGTPAWKTLPSWYAISTKDKMIPPAGQRQMARWINAKKTVQIPASHSVAVSHPGAVTKLIETAATSVTR